MNPRLSELCPCCGQAKPPTTYQWVPEQRTFICTAGSVKFTKMRASVFDFIWSHDGAGSVDQIADHVWQLDPNGGPAGWTRTLSTHMAGMRRLLEPLGYTIGTKADSYRLIKYVTK